jgi:carbamoyl-phosphate synthase large subunit
MENFDPLWVHTWESIVIAPSQTLSNQDYQMLRSIARKVISHLWVIWECNIQYALSPNSDEYRVIEVNARLSRSSALASKATWYPLAYVAWKLALWYLLTDLKNEITQITSANFEPALDYLAIKIPRWDLDKFKMVSQKISSEMKSVWEVMSIWRNFEEAIQKWVRMLQIWVQGLCFTPFEIDEKWLEDELKNPSVKRIYSVAKALQLWFSVEKINDLSKIDKWFLEKIKNIVDLKKEIIEKWKINKEFLKKAKSYWFSDDEIWEMIGKNEKEIRIERKKLWINPVAKQIDTLAGEFEAKTNYLYTTYNWDFNDI